MIIHEFEGTVKEIMSTPLLLTRIKEYQTEKWLL